MSGFFISPAHSALLVCFVFPPSAADLRWISISQRVVRRRTMFEAKRRSSSRLNFHQGKEYTVDIEAARSQGSSNREEECHTPAKRRRGRDEKDKPNRSWMVFGALFLVQLINASYNVMAQVRERLLVGACTCFTGTGFSTNVKKPCLHNMIPNSVMWSRSGCEYSCIASTVEREFNDAHLGMWVGIVILELHTRAE